MELRIGGLNENLHDWNIWRSIRPWALREPQAAVGWALELPVESLQMDILKNVFQHLRRTDPDLCKELAKPLQLRKPLWEKLTGVDGDDPFANWLDFP